MPSSSIRLWKLWVAAGVSAGLLELPFPVAGPMPVWRAVFAWIGLVPLLWAILAPFAADAPKPLRRAFLLAYLCGVLWYCGNCYWIYATMRLHGGLPQAVSALLLVGYSMVLGLYFGAFGLCVALLRRVSGSTRLALAAAPVLWTALELAGARITCVPWDQLGYSQVDNALVNRLAPWTGVYGIGFVLVAVNALIAGALTLPSPARSLGRNWSSDRRIWGAAGLLLLVVGASGIAMAPPKPPATETAVLVQPNLNVSGDNDWGGKGWEQHIAEFNRLAADQCKSYIAGIPETGASQGEAVCPPYPTHPALVVWPESPAPYFEADPRFQQMLKALAVKNQAALAIGSLGMEYSIEERAWHDYNSAIVVGANGERVGRYDKIHLVPFGEYIPFKELLFFAHKLTGRVSELSRGEERKVFRLDGHSYGVFICYEAVFADEVREFAQLGAQVFVNISDDAWYGDTSAPWQHLNMARMRAIENRRWILRDTNNGVTASIDPYGRVRQSIPRHAVDALPAGFAFRSDITFYTAHGDIFAGLCAVLAFCLVGWAGRMLLRQWVALPGTSR
jgi:apolipoprotein N-acyltransferase